MNKRRRFKAKRRRRAIQHAVRRITSGPVRPMMLQMDFESGAFVWWKRKATPVGGHVHVAWHKSKPSQSVEAALSRADQP